MFKTFLKYSVFFEKEDNNWTKKQHWYVRKKIITEENANMKHKLYFIA